MIEEMKLPERVLDELISKILMMQEAKRLGLTVSDDELRESIESLPAFQLEGRVDQRMYERALRLSRLTAEQFEQMQRENLVLTKLVTLVRLNGGKISEDEVLETFRFENERINLAFLKISPDSFRGQVQRYRGKRLLPEEPGGVQDSHIGPGPIPGLPVFRYGGEDPGFSRRCQADLRLSER
jgi:peptidyl-prolyl cis-trans isomerase D